MRKRLPVLELVLIVALALPLAVFAPPYVQGAMARIAADDAADAVADAISDARRLARSRERIVNVILDVRLGSVAVEGGLWRKLPGGVSLAGPPPDSQGMAVIAFSPDGRSSGGQVVVASDGKAWSLVVEPDTGRLKRVRAGAP